MDKKMRTSEPLNPDDPHQKAKPGSGRIFLTFAVFCILILPLIVFKALFSEQVSKKMESIDPGQFSNESIFKHFDQMPTAYMDGSSSDRTLEEYYSRRQYLGAPPIIPHEIKAADDKGCLTCHAKGGWTTDFKRFTPVTPHPEKSLCRQCHVKPVTERLFVENDWHTIMPPLLGRSHLPGAPPPVPHSLQMRENCIACHVGPGAVTPIRVEHPMRGNCSQCHIPENTHDFFERPITKN